MPEVWLELDTALRERLREVLADPTRRLTEADLRKLVEEGRAYILILRAELARLQQRLAEVDSDPATPLTTAADAFRRANEFRTHVDELERLLSELDGHVREVRTSWLGTPRSPRDAAGRQ